MCDIISFTLDQESFALDGLRPNSTTNIFGMIQIHSESLCFTPPVWTQVQLIGREQIGNTCRIIVNDTYQLSNYPDDWQSSPSLCASVKSMAVDYKLPFSLSVPSNMPTSFQIYDQQEDFVCCRIFYTLEIKVSSMDQRIVQPIRFHRSNIMQRKSTSLNQEEDDEEEEHMPKRVFWGITKQSKNQRWQYELEFPNAFDLVTSKAGCISLRLRSVHGNRKDIKGDCCLIGCQIIQSIHLEGYQTYIQVLSTATKLLTSPNKTWLHPCHVDFDLENPILPTVDNQRLGVEHFIRITVEFCNEEGGESDCCSLDLQFPVVFTGCALIEQVPIEKSVNGVTNSTITRTSSSCTSSFGETVTYNGAIDLQSICNYSHAYEIKI